MARAATYQGIERLDWPGEVDRMVRTGPFDAIVSDIFRFYVVCCLWRVFQRQEAFQHRGTCHKISVPLFSQSKLEFILIW